MEDAKGQNRNGQRGIEYGVRLAITESFEKKWYPDCLEHQFAENAGVEVDRLFSQTVLKELAEANSNMEAESFFSQLKAYFLGENSEDGILEKLKWNVVPSPSGELCVVLGPDSNVIELCDVKHGMRTNLLEAVRHFENGNNDTSFSLIEPCIAAWNTNESVLAIGGGGCSQIFLFAVVRNHSNLLVALRHVVADQGRGAVSGLHFRTPNHASSPYNSELLVVYQNGALWRIFVSNLLDSPPCNPLYAPSGAEISCKIQAASVVQYSTLLNRPMTTLEGDSHAFFASDDQRVETVASAPAVTTSDILFLASDLIVTVVRLIDSPPYFQSVRKFSLLLPGQRHPPTKSSFFRSDGVSSIPKFARIKKITLSPKGHFIATLTLAGQVVVRRSGLQILPAKDGVEQLPMDLGNAIVAAESSSRVFDVTWWSANHVVLSLTNGNILVKCLDEEPQSEIDTTTFDLYSSTLSNEFGAPKCSWPAFLSTGGGSVFVLDCTKSWIEPIQLRGLSREPEIFQSKAMARRYQLRIMKETEPDQLLRSLIAKRDFALAITLGQKYKLSLDLVHKARWRASSATVESINEVLSLIQDVEWVLDECLNHVPMNLEATQALVQFGVGKASDALRDAPDWTAIEDRERKLKVLHSKLLLFKISTSKEFDPFEFASFRTGNPLGTVTNIAESGNIKALELAIKLFPFDTIPHLLHLLSAIPETVSPIKYEHLLPAIPSLEATVVPFHVMHQGEVIPFSKLKGVNNNPSVTWAPRNEETPPLLSSEEICYWYSQRARDIDTWSGQLDLSLELCECAILRVPCGSELQRLRDSDSPFLAGIVQLVQLRDAAALLARLVYRCKLTDSIQLVDWAAMTDYERICTIAQDTTSENVVEVLTGRLVPLYRELQNPSDLSVWLTHLRNYLVARASGILDPILASPELLAAQDADPNCLRDIQHAEEGIQICANVIYQSRPLSIHEGGVDPSQRLIPIPQALIEISLACIYSCPCVSKTALQSMDTIFESLPDRIPHLENKVKALSLLQDRLEELDGHLFVNTELSELGLAVPMKTFIKCCSDHERLRMEKLKVSEPQTNPETIAKQIVSGNDEEVFGLSFHPSESSDEDEDLMEDPEQDSSPLYVGSSFACLNDTETSAIDDDGRSLVINVLHKAISMNAMEWIKLSKYINAEERSLSLQNEQVARKKFWEHVVHLVWDIRNRAIPYLSERFCTKYTLVSLLRAAQFDLAHELIESINVHEEGSVLSRRQVENLVLMVSKEFFNSASDFAFKEMDYAKRTLRALPFSSSRVQEEKNLIEVVDMLANEFGAPMVPLQIRLYMKSEKPIRLIEDLFEKNPVIYFPKEKNSPSHSISAHSRPDAKILRLSTLLGIDGVAPIARVRLTVVKHAIKNGHLDVATNICDSMVEKMDILKQLHDTMDTTKREQMQRANELTGRACLLLAQALNQSSDTSNVKKFAELGLIRCAAYDLPGCLELVQSIGYQLQSEIPYERWKMHPLTGLEDASVHHKVSWAVAETLKNADLAAVIICELLSSSEGDVCKTLQEAFSALKVELSQSDSLGHFHVEILSALVHGFALNLFGSASSEILSMPTSALLKKISDSIQTKSVIEDHSKDYLNFLNDILLESSSLMQGQQLLTLLPHVDIARFSEDPSYREKFLFSAAREIGMEMVSDIKQSDRWKILMDATADYDVSESDIQSAYLFGLLCSTSKERTETELDSLVTRSDSFIQSVLDNFTEEAQIRLIGRLCLQVWASDILGIFYRRLMLVDKLLHSVLKRLSSKEKEFQVALNNIFKERRKFFLLLEKHKVKLDAKKLVQNPILVAFKVLEHHPSTLQALMDECVELSPSQYKKWDLDPELAMAEVVRVMNKDNALAIAKFTRNIDIHPNFRPSQILLEYLLFSLRLKHTEKENPSDVQEEFSQSSCLTSIDAPTALVSRRCFTSEIQVLAPKLKPEDAVVLAKQAAYLGATKRVIGLDTRSKIVRLCSDIISQCSEVDETMQMELNEARAFVDTVSFLLEKMEMDSTLVLVLNDLERTEGDEEKIMAVLRTLAAVPHTDVQLIFQTCQSLSPSSGSNLRFDPKTIFLGVVEDVLNDLDCYETKLTTLVAKISSLIDSSEYRSVGEAMLTSLRRAANGTLPNEIRVSAIRAIQLSGLDQAGDEGLLQDILSLQMVQTFWGVTTDDISLEDVSGSVKRKALLDRLGLPSDGNRIGMAKLLAHWEGLSGSIFSLEFPDEVKQHAEENINYLLSKRVAVQFEKSAKEISLYSSEWSKLFLAALCESSSTELSQFNVKRYADGTALMSEAQEMELFTRLSTTGNLATTLSFGYFSCYETLQAAALAVHRNHLEENFEDDDTLLLCLSSTDVTVLWSSSCSTQRERVMRLSLDLDNGLYPFTWSPLYLILTLVCEGKIREAGQVTERLHRIHPRLNVGASWASLLQHTILSCTETTRQQQGWSYCVNLAQVALSKMQTTVQIEVSILSGSGSPDSAANPDWEEWDEEGEEDVHELPQDGLVHRIPSALSAIPTADQDGSIGWDIEDDLDQNETELESTEQNPGLNHAYEKTHNSGWNDGCDGWEDDLELDPVPLSDRDDRENFSGVQDENGAGNGKEPNESEEQENIEIENCRTNSGWSEGDEDLDVHNGNDDSTLSTKEDLNATIPPPDDGEFDVSATGWGEEEEDLDGINEVPLADSFVGSEVEQEGFEDSASIEAVQRFVEDLHIAQPTSSDENLECSNGQDLEEEVDEVPMSTEWNDETLDGIDGSIEGSASIEAVQRLVEELHVAQPTSSDENLECTNGQHFEEKADEVPMSTEWDDETLEGIDDIPDFSDSIDCTEVPSSTIKDNAALYKGDSAMQSLDHGEQIPDEEVQELVEHPQMDDEDLKGLNSSQDVEMNSDLNVEVEELPDSSQWGCEELEGIDDLSIDADDGKGDEPDLSASLNSPQEKLNNLSDGSAGQSQLEDKDLETINIIAAKGINGDAVDSPFVNSSTSHCKHRDECNHESYEEQTEEVISDNIGLEKLEEPPFNNSEIALDQNLTEKIGLEHETANSLDRASLGEKEISDRGGFLVESVTSPTGPERFIDQISPHKTSDSSAYELSEAVENDLLEEPTERTPVALESSDNGNCSQATMNADEGDNSLENVPSDFTAAEAEEELLFATNETVITTGESLNGVEGPIGGWDQEDTGVGELSVDTPSEPIPSSHVGALDPPSKDGISDTPNTFYSAEVDQTGAENEVVDGWEDGEELSELTDAQFSDVKIGESKLCDEELELPNAADISSTIDAEVYQTLVENVRAGGSEDVQELKKLGTPEIEQVETRNCMADDMDNRLEAVNERPLTIEEEGETQQHLSSWNEEVLDLDIAAFPSTLSKDSKDTCLHREDDKCLQVGGIDDKQIGDTSDYRNEDSEFSKASQQDETLTEVVDDDAALSKEDSSQVDDRVDEEMRAADCEGPGESDGGGWGGDDDDLEIDDLVESTENQLQLVDKKVDEEAERDGEGTSSVANSIEANLTTADSESSDQTLHCTGGGGGALGNDIDMHKPIRQGLDVGSELDEKDGPDDDRADSGWGEDDEMDEELDMDIDDENQVEGSEEMLGYSPVAEKSVVPHTGSAANGWADDGLDLDENDKEDIGLENDPTKSVDDNERRPGGPYHDEISGKLHGVLSSQSRSGSEDDDGFGSNDDDDQGGELQAEGQELVRGDTDEGDGDVGADEEDQITGNTSSGNLRWNERNKPGIRERKSDDEDSKPGTEDDYRRMEEERSYQSTDRSSAAEDFTVQGSESHEKPDSQSWDDEELELEDTEIEEGDRRDKKLSNGKKQSYSGQWEEKYFSPPPAELDRENIMKSVAFVEGAVGGSAVEFIDPSRGESQFRTQVAPYRWVNENGVERSVRSHAEGRPTTDYYNANGDYERARIPVPAPYSQGTLETSREGAIEDSLQDTFGTDAEPQSNGWGEDDLMLDSDSHVLGQGFDVKDGGHGIGELGISADFDNFTPEGGWPDDDSLEIEDHPGEMFAQLSDKPDQLSSSHHDHGIGGQAEKPVFSSISPVWTGKQNDEFSGTFAPTQSEHLQMNGEWSKGDLNLTVSLHKTKPALMETQEFSETFAQSPVKWVGRGVSQKVKVEEIQKSGKHWMENYENVYDEEYDEMEDDDGGGWENDPLELEDDIGMGE